MDDKVICPRCNSPVLLEHPSPDVAVSVCCGAAILITHLSQLAPDDSQAEIRVLSNSDYPISRFVAAGMTAAIFAAYDTQLNRTVAVKISLHSTPFFSKLLLLSAQKVSAVEHPAVVPTYAVVAFENLFVLGSQHKTVVMRLVDGVPLSRVQLDSQSDYEKLTILSRVCDALAACHTANFFHGDLQNLDNILLADGLHPYLIDPGLSRRIDNPGERIEGFRRHDLKSLQSLAEFLFMRTLSLEIGENDSVRTVQAAVEKRLSLEFAFQNAAYSRRRRIETTGVGPGAGQIYIYERKEVRHTLFHSFRRSRYRLRIFPLEPYEYYRLVTYADRYLRQDELTVTVVVEGEEGVRTCAVTVEVKEQTETSTILVATAIMRPPLEAMRTHSVTVEYELGNTEDLLDGRCSEDFSVLTRECVLELGFPESPMPTAWRAYRQRSVEATELEDIALNDFFKLDEDAKIARLSLQNLRPGESIHLDYGGGPEVYRDITGN